MSRRYRSVLAFFGALDFFGSADAVAQEAPRDRLIHAEMETELVPSPAMFDVLLPLGCESSGTFSEREALAGLLCASLAVVKPKVGSSANAGT